MKQTGLNNEYAENTAAKLNELLADVQIMYMNTRGFHWNIKGNRFFILHEKFEEFYNELNLMADQIAERILMIGGKPVHAYSQYIKMASIQESINKDSAEETINEILEGLTVLLKKERSIIAEAAQHSDDGTVDLLTGYISAQEKEMWMYGAFLG